MDEPASTPGTELTELLSAYLDGELTAEARQQVEELLVRDPHARGELQRLERAWQLLDGLPRVELEPSFTQSTVEMIAVSVADDVRAGSNQGPRRPWAFFSVLSLLGVGAAIAGFVFVRLAVPDPNAALLRDLPVIENVEHYLQAGDIEFLRALKRAGLFRRGGSNDSP
jgi:anti-sigma factor RsiW